MPKNDETKQEPAATSQATADTTATAAPVKDAASERVQQVFDQEQKQGFRGVEVDTTDNRAYTLQGVLAGEPTPETDPQQAEKVGSTKFKGVTPNTTKTDAEPTPEKRPGTE